MRAYRGALGKIEVMLQRMDRPFSKNWMLLSAAIFVVAQVLLGGVVADLVGATASLHTRFLIEAVLNLTSYFVGGVIIGMISPGIRIYEPAVGAALCVAMMFVVTVFTPLSFLSFSLGKLLIGGAIAFSLGLFGAKIGERLVGNRVD